ncbi:MAG TPA: hypothetical protein DCR65_04595 [Gammaproteobacteria bacterium]|nr:hypothetical protein [Gammaproteobacteria bacterium]
MPLARPYQADTPLDRVVDALPPEAFDAQRLRALATQALTDDNTTIPGCDAASARTALRALAALWSALPPAGTPQELDAAAQALIEVGDIVTDLLDGRVTPAEAHRALAAHARPFGEYLLSCVPILMAAVADRSGIGAA